VYRCVTKSRIGLPSAATIAVPPVALPLEYVFWPEPGIR
jgi:hypothetical protein